MVFWPSPSSRYGIIAHRGHRAVAGHGWMTGYQNIRRRSEEACVLDDVPAVGAEGELKGRGDVPEPGSGDECDPAYERVGEPVECAADGARAERAADDGLGDARR